MDHLCQGSQILQGLLGRNANCLQRTILPGVDNGSQFRHQVIGIAADMALAHLLRTSGLIAHLLECVRIITHHHIRIDCIQDGLQPGLQLFGIFAR